MVMVLSRVAWAVSVVAIAAVYHMGLAYFMQSGMGFQPARWMAGSFVSFYWLFLVWFIASLGSGAISKGVASQGVKVLVFVLAYLVVVPIFFIVLAWGLAPLSERFELNLERTLFLIFAVLPVIYVQYRIREHFPVRWYLVAGVHVVVLCGLYISFRHFFHTLPLGLGSFLGTPLEFSVAMSLPSLPYVILVGCLSVGTEGRSRTLSVLLMLAVCWVPLTLVGFADSRDLLYRFLSPIGALNDFVSNDDLQATRTRISGDLRQGRCVWVGERYMRFRKADLHTRTMFGTHREYIGYQYVTLFLETTNHPRIEVLLESQPGAEFPGSTSCSSNPPWDEVKCRRQFGNDGLRVTLTVAASDEDSLQRDEEDVRRWLRDAACETEVGPS